MMLAWPSRAWIAFRSAPPATEREPAHGVLITHTKAERIFARYSCDNFRCRSEQIIYSARKCQVGPWSSARYDAGLVFSPYRGHLIELDPDERGPGRRLPRGFSQQDLSPRWNHEARRRLMLPGVVSALGPRAERLCGVVEAAEQPRGIEIEDLLARVGGQVWRKGHGEATPVLTLLVPGRQLAVLDARPQQQEGRSEVVPQRVAHEVQQVEVVPPEVMPEITESRVGIPPLGEHLPVLGLNADEICLEQSASARARVGGEDSPGRCGGD